MDKPRRIEAEDCAYTIGPFEAYDADAMDAWLRDEVLPVLRTARVLLVSDGYDVAAMNVVIGQLEDTDGRD